MDQQPGSSKSTASTSSATPELLSQSLIGMRPATTLSEWQLQAVLFRAKLTQYYDTFIAQGGDDIDQLMECDETEFLEIMTLIGMATKPLHVRRLQRTLADFSKNRETFLQQAIQQIGAPPLPSIFATQSTDPTETLRALLSQPIQAQPQLIRSQALFGATPSTSATQFRLPFPTFSAPSSISTPPISLAGIPVADLITIVSGGTLPTIHPSPLPLSSSLISPPTSALGAQGSPQASTSGTAQQSTPTLSESDIERLKASALIVLKNKPESESKTTQRKPTREVQSLILLPAEHPDRAARFRQVTKIYGRPESKNKPQRALTHHEVLINEAAAQLCLQQSDLLTRRSELFTLARQVTRISGLQQHRIRDMEERARQLGEQSISPSIRSTPTPDEFLGARSRTSSIEPIEETGAEPTPAKRRRESSSTSTDPKKPKQ
ncbi:CBR-MAB-10 protein [Aphelenchoides bicaudatus]|nr:CBR-MAB-10 protein [Aphelenchoides bicaudatus]